MIEQSELASLVDERHGDPPDPIPNADDRRVLFAAQHRQLTITSGGKVVIRGSHAYSSAPMAAYRRCLARRWIAPADHLVLITDAGAAAALTRRHR